jgi:signal transduction histidine kinase
MAIVFWVTILACVIGWLLAYRVTRPLTQITNIARRITSGDLQSGTEVQGQGEVAELSAAFNLMTSRLRRMIEQERQTGQELSRLNCELEQSNLELRRSNQDLADFAHAASHDLKTPLRALRALPEWIQDDLDGVDLPQNVQGHLQNLQAQGERMDNVITGLLEYSRVGKAENQAQTFDPRATAIRVLQLLAIPDRFTVDLIVEPQKITGVQPEFEIVLRNLVQNAVAHHDREHGRIGIRCSDSDQTLVLEVSDDGPGIPPEFHERVLLPFQSLKRRDKGGGSGLGLALVNKIVQRSGGKLKIVSEAGTRGTLFRATLPIKSSALDVISTSAQAA